MTATTIAVGARLGMLVVVRELSMAGIKRKSGQGNLKRWLVRCDCGAEEVYSSTALTTRAARSCIDCEDETRFGVNDAPAFTQDGTPTLVPGLGEKRECARYTACLKAFVKRAPTATRAHCPSSCAFHVPLSRVSERAEAIARVAYEKRGFNHAC